jgi:DNA helicase-2/ATP-dependent DNA helicase PcrA
LNALVTQLARWRAAANELPPGDLAELVLDESGYTAMWQADKSADAPGRLENLKELVAALEEFDTLTAFLEHVSLVMERDQAGTGEQVSMMSLHAAKGLEFYVVFLPGWEEGLFPHQRSLDQSGSAGLEEERRLAYVGLTRARRRAYVFYAANRRLFNQWQANIPSRFVEELPAEHIETRAATGLYGAAPRRPGWGDLAEGESDWVVPQRMRGGVSGRAFDARKVGPSRYTAEAPPAQTAEIKPGDRVFHQ